MRLKRKRDAYDVAITIICMLAVIAIAFVTSGCSVRRHMQKNEAEEGYVDTQATVVEENESVSLRNSSTERKLDTEILKHGELDVTIEDYDTDKPGNPVKRRTTIKGKTDEAQKENEEYKEEVSEADSTEKRTDTYLVSHEQYNKEMQKEAEGGSGLYWMPLLSLGMLVFLIVEAIKNKDKYK